MVRAETPSRSSIRSNAAPWGSPRPRNPIILAAAALLCLAAPALANDSFAELKQGAAARWTARLNNVPPSPSMAKVTSAVGSQTFRRFTSSREVALLKSELMRPLRVNSC